MQWSTLFGANHDRKARRTAQLLLRLAHAALVVGCSSEGTSSEGLREIAEARGALSSEFYYFRCNSTGWDADSETQMLPTGNPNEYSMLFSVTEDWMTTVGEHCTVVSTDQENGWGAAQSWFGFAADETSLNAPGSWQLVPVPSGTDPHFRVLYPSLGPYEAIFNSTTRQLTIRTPQPSDCVSDRLIPVGVHASSVEPSSPHCVSCGAELAIDDKTTTRWSSEFRDPAWIYLDLGAPKRLERIVLRWETAASADYDILISNDAQNWTKVYTDAAGNGGVDEIRGLNETARYVKMHSRARTTQWGVSLWEFELYGDNDAACGACGVGPLTLELTGQSPGWLSPQNVLDGVVGPGAPAALGDGNSDEYLEYSFPRELSITKARLWEDNGGNWNVDTWKLQYWNGTAFVDASSFVATPEAGWNEVSFAPVTTNRIRVFLRDAVRIEARELQVFGGDGTCRTPAPLDPACHPYIGENAARDLTFSVTLPTQRQHVEVFARQNGNQNIALNITSSEVANANGTFTYSHTEPGARYAAGDLIQARFYSYEPGGAPHFTPGSGETEWSPTLVVGSDQPLERTSAIRVTPRCVHTRGDGSKLAFFDIANKLSCPIEIPAGIDNWRSDRIAGRQPPVVFQPGLETIAVPFDTGFTWQLGVSAAVIDSSTPACTQVVEQLDAPVVVRAVQDHEQGTTDRGTRALATPISFTIPPKLDVTVGSAGNGTAILTYKDENGSNIQCTYRGGSRVANARRDRDKVLGRAYFLVSCSNGLTAGSPARGSEWNIDVVSGDSSYSRTDVEAHLGEGCSGPLEAPIAPETSIALRQGFSWENTVALPTTDPLGRPAMVYALIYVETKKQLEALRTMRVYFRVRPIFSQELERYAGKCGTFDSIGDGTGIFVHSLIPAALYNYWRDVSLVAFTNNAGEIPFRAVLLPALPDPALGNADGTVSWDMLKASGFQYFTAPSPMQQPFSLGIPLVDDVIEVAEDVGEAVVDTVATTVDALLPGEPVQGLIQIGEDIIQTTISIAPTLDQLIEASVDILETTWDLGTQLVGAIDAFFAGSITVEVNLDVLNRDPLFDINNVMRQAWGQRHGQELAPHGVDVDILKWGNIPILPESFRGTMNREGIARIKVAKGGSSRGSSGICILLENDAGMISSGITENELCDFRTEPSFSGFDSDLTDQRASGGSDNSIHLRSNHRELNFLTQVTDGADYLSLVVERTPHQAEISVGFVANNVNGDIPFAACLDFPTTLPLVDAIPALASAVAGPVGLFAAPLVRKDIFVPNVPRVNDSRGAISHEYGHFAMCDLFFHESPRALREAITNRIAEGDFEATAEDSRDKTFAVMMESFADYFASQITSGTNYVLLPLTAKAQGVYMDYCKSSACLEYNFTGTGDSDVDRHFDDEVAKYVTLLHDAFDRPDDAWRTHAVPSNGDAWFAPTGSTMLFPNPAAYELDVDDRVSLFGKKLKTWVSSAIGGCNESTGTAPNDDRCEFTRGRAMQALASTMYGQNATWCDVCELFAQHEGASVGLSRVGLWNLCQQGGLAGIVGEPPEANLRLDATTCSACGPHQRSVGGVCQTCNPGEIAVGPHCDPCGLHQVPGAAETCVDCPANSIAVAGACVSCPFGQGAAPNAELCVDCPADAAVNWGALAEPGCFETTLFPATSPNDLCPHQLWVGINNVASVGPGSVHQSDLKIQVHANPTEIPSLICALSRAEASVASGTSVLRSGQCYGNYCAPPAPDAFEQCVLGCTDPGSFDECEATCAIDSQDTCNERCEYGCPTIVSSAEAQAMGNLRVLVNLENLAASAAVSIAAEDQCGIR